MVGLSKTTPAFAADSLKVCLEVCMMYVCWVTVTTVMVSEAALESVFTEDCFPSHLGHQNSKV